jgi:hypothetical protein
MAGASARGGVRLPCSGLDLRRPDSTRMTQQQAERAADILLVAAAAGVAYFVLRDPALRRRAWQVIRSAAAASGPWLIAETQRAWAESAQTPSGL